MQQLPLFQIDMSGMPDAATRLAIEECRAAILALRSQVTQLEQRLAQLELQATIPTKRPPKAQTQE